MAEVFTADDIDFSAYLTVTDAKQKVKSAALYVQELIDRIKSPVREHRNVMPWRKTHQLVQFRPGEVTVWGGANGSGKSLVTGQVALSLCAQRERVCIASFEMKPVRTLERMCRQYSCFNPNAAFMDDEAKALLIDIYDEFKGWTDGKLWLYDQQGTVTAAQVCAVARYFHQELKGTHFVVDSLMKCVSGEDDYNGQKKFVDDLTSIARDSGMHIHLIHHIRKPGKEEDKPSKYDYKGSGSITDQVDNVISVWRNKVKEKKIQAGLAVDHDKDPDAMLICDKQRNGEWEGAIGLWFDPESQQFLANNGDKADDKSFYHPEER